MGSQPDNYHPYTDHTNFDYVDINTAASQNYGYPRAQAEARQPGQHNAAAAALPSSSAGEYHPVNWHDDDGTTAALPPRRPRRYRVFRRWGWEMGSLGLAVALLIATVAILRAFEGRRVPDWGEWVNLNTIVALLSTFLRGAVVVVIAELISHAKWAWFGAGRSRPLRHLQDFDSGSRGVWGALCLVPTVLRGSGGGGGDWATLLAALLLVASFAVGPTAQQAIRSSVCEYAVPGLNASLPYAHYVPRAGGYVRGYPGSRGNPDSDTRVAIASSLSSPDGVENLVTANCPTGNCTFTDGDPIVGGGGDDSDNDSDNDEGRSGLRDTSYSTIGLCHSCLDVSSLATGAVGEAVVYTNFSLPSGLSIYHGSFGIEMNVTTDSRLDWLGGLATPEFVRAARWSLANVTLLTTSLDGCDSTDTANITCPAFEGDGLSQGSTSVRAAACVLYPCLRTYVASVTNGLLVEDQIDSAPAVPDLGTSSNLSSAATQLQDSGADSNIDNHYTAIKSPCRAGGTTYTAETMSTAANATAVVLYETRGDGSYATRNASAPEACIYRHNAEFAYAVHRVLRDSLRGSCMLDPRLGPACSQGLGQTSDELFYRPMELLYNGGNASVGLIDGYFRSVAAALTNRYRATFGSAVFDDTNEAGLGPVWGGRQPQALPPGAAEGVVWQATVCTVVHWEWLSFPAALVALTSGLLALAVAGSWRERHARPVWKTNLLPLLFHGDRFGLARGPPSSSREPPSKEGATAVVAEVYDDDDGDDGDGSQGRKQPLLESAQMEEQASKIMTTFQWPESSTRRSRNDTIQGGGKSSRLGLWRRNGRKLKQWDEDSLQQRGS